LVEKNVTYFLMAPTMSHLQQPRMFVCTFMLLQSYCHVLITGINKLNDKNECNLTSTVNKLLCLLFITER